MQNSSALPFVGHLHHFQLRALFCVLIDRGKEMAMAMMMRDLVYF
jgi:hypothetical protein